MMGLPSLQALDRAQGARIWLAAEATDMRCGFDRLAERVRAVIGQDPLRVICLCFARAAGTDWKYCCGTATDSRCGTSDWKLGCSSYRGCRKECARWSCVRAS